MERIERKHQSTGRYDNRHYSILKTEWNYTRKKSEHNFRDLWDYYKIPNIHVIRIPKKEKKYTRAERVLEDIIAENYPNLTTEINWQLQKAEQTRKNSKKLTPGHTIIKLLKTKTKKNLENSDNTLPI